MIYSLILLQAQVDSNIWGSVLSQAVTIAGTALLILIVQHFGKGMLGRSEERFKIIEERLNQADKERDELGRDINKVREEGKDNHTEILRAMDKIGYQYNELMRVFQTVEANNKEEKDYLKKLLEILQKRDK